LKYPSYGELGVNRGWVKQEMRRNSKGKYFFWERKGGRTSKKVGRVPGISIHCSLTLIDYSISKNKKSRGE